MRLLTNLSLCVVAVGFAPAVLLAQQPFHSVTHPFAEPMVPGPGGAMQFSDAFSISYGLVATNSRTNLYSASVNQINGSRLLPTTTWLATDAGIKRLDLKSRIVQHYTIMDGLPSQKTIAIGSMGDHIVCISDLEGPERRIELCMLDPGSQRWKRLGSQPLEKAAISQSARYQHLPAALLAANLASAALVTTNATTDRSIGALYNLESNRWEALPPPPIASKLKAFRILTAQMDDANLWVGADVGLYRFDLQARRWATVIPDVEIASSAIEKDGSLWVLMMSAEAYHRDVEKGRVRNERWSAEHIVNGVLERSFTLTARLAGENEWDSLWLENLTLADGKVWVTNGRVLGFAHMQMAYLPEIRSLNPATGELTTIEAPNRDDGDVGTYAAVPDAVLANSHTGLGQLSPLRMRRRFAGWVCNDDIPQTAQRPGAFGAPTAAPDNHWYYGFTSNAIRHGSYLTHQVGRDISYYEPPMATLSVQDQAVFPTVIGGRVFFLAGHFGPALMVWDRSTNSVEPISAVNAVMKPNRASGSDQGTMLAGGNSLWITVGAKLIKYDTVSRLILTAEGDQQLAIRYSPAFGLLGVQGDTAWIKGAPNKLYRADPAHSNSFILVQPPVLPRELEAVRAKMTPVAMTGSIIWFSLSANVLPSDRPVIGLNTETNRWTKPIEASLPYVLPGGVVTGYIEVENGSAIHWLPTMSRECSAIGYNATTGEWIKLPPAPQSNRLPDHMIGVSASEALFCADDLVYRLNRSKAGGKWTTDKLQFHFSVFFNNGLQWQGDEIYFGSGAGVWQYNVLTHLSHQSPGIPTPASEMMMQVKAEDKKYVWITAGRGGNDCIGRFDKANHDWRFWTAAQGAPEGWIDFFSGDKGCWLLCNARAYRLNAAQDRWEDLSHTLAIAGEDLTFRQALLVKGDLWLVRGVSPTMTSAQPSPVSAGAPLYRCDADKITAVNPTPGRTLSPENLSLYGDRLLFAAREGAFELRDDGARPTAWTTIIPSALPAGFAAPVPVYAVDSESHERIWLVSTDNAVSFIR